MKKLINIFLTIAMISFSACAKAENKISMDDLKGTIWFNADVGRGEMYDERIRICQIKDSNWNDFVDKEKLYAVSSDGKYRLSSLDDNIDGTLAYVLKDNLNNAVVDKFNFSKTHGNSKFILDNNKLFYAKDDLGSEFLDDDDNKVLNIYSYDIESEKELRLTEYNYKGRIIWSLSLAPNKSKLAYAYSESNGNDSHSILNVLNLKDNSIEHYNYSTSDSAWLSDSELIFDGLKYKDGERLSESRMTILNIDTGEETIIPYEDGNDKNYATEFAVSPDGKYIAFLRGLVGGKQLWVMHRDGTGQVRIPIAGIEGNLAWTE